MILSDKISLVQGRGDSGIEAGGDGQAGRSFKLTVKVGIFSCCHQRC